MRPRYHPLDPEQGERRTVEGWVGMDLSLEAIGRAVLMIGDQWRQDQARLASIEARIAALEARCPHPNEEAQMQEGHVQAGEGG